MNFSDISADISLKLCPHKFFEVIFFSVRVTKTAGNLYGTGFLLLFLFVLDSLSFWQYVPLSTMRFFVNISLDISRKRI